MSKIVITDQHGAPMKRSASAYRGAGGRHPVMTNWNAGRYSGHSALKLSREGLSDRIHDLARNDGWASAAVSRFVDNLVGSGWRLTAKPNARTLGLTRDQADEVSEQLEALWFDYVNDRGFWCDVERATNMAGLLGLATRHLFADGEALGWIGWREGAPTGLATCVQVIDPMRLSNPHGAMDTDTMRDGVEIDEWGAATRYHIRQSHPGDMLLSGRGRYQWDAFDRETAWGRPTIVHLREKRWAGMSRATSCLAPIVTKLKQITQYDDYELQAASLNAMLAAFVTTPMDPSIFDEGSADVSDYAQSEIDYYGQNPLELEGVKLGFLHPGSKIDTIKAEHPAGNSESFIRSGLRNIASAAGVTYEALTADYSQANYSSIRAAMVDVKKGLSATHSMVGSLWQGQIYQAFVEEVFDRGLIAIPSGTPSFEAMPTAWSHSMWVGPGAGWVDPKKEAEAAILRMASGVSTLQDEVANQGGDYKDKIDQTARERKQRLAAGLDPNGPQLETAQSVEPPEDDDIDDRNTGPSQNSARVPSVNRNGR